MIILKIKLLARNDNCFTPFPPCDHIFFYHIMDILGLQIPRQAMMSCHLGKNAVLAYGQNRVLLFVQLTI